MGLDVDPGEEAPFKEIERRGQSCSLGSPWDKDAATLPPEFIQRPLG